MSHAEICPDTPANTPAVSPTASTPVSRQPARQIKSGPNRRLLPWLGVAALALLLLIGLGWWFAPRELHGVLIQSPNQADDFTLMSSTGEPMQLSDFRGQYVALFFGYTYCPDVCPTTLNDLQVMVDALGPRRAENVQVLMISVDPERDTVEQLQTYLRHFDPSFIGMTGTVEEIQPIASSFGIYFEKHEDTGLVDHTGAVTIIDPEGYVRLIIPKGLDGPTGEEMAQDLTYLMRRG